MPHQDTTFYAFNPDDAGVSLNTHVSRYIACHYDPVEAPKCATFLKYHYEDTYLQPAFKDIEIRTSDKPYLDKIIPQSVCTEKNVARQLELGRQYMIVDYMRYGYQSDMSPFKQEFRHACKKSHLFESYALLCGLREQNTVDGKEKLHPEFKKLLTSVQKKNPEKYETCLKESLIRSVVDLVGAHYELSQKSTFSDDAAAIHDQVESVKLFELTDIAAVQIATYMKNDKKFYETLKEEANETIEANDLFERMIHVVGRKQRQETLNHMLDNFMSGKSLPMPPLRPSPN